MSVYISLFYEGLLENISGKKTQQWRLNNIWDRSGRKIVEKLKSEYGYQRIIPNRYENYCFFYFPTQTFDMADLGVQTTKKLLNKTIRPSNFPTSHVHKSNIR